LRYETEAALASESWLKMRPDSVLEFLQMSFLKVKEPELARALFKWGRAQVNQDGEDPEDGEKLRSKILPFLKFINFRVLSNREFALLCLEDLGRVLSSNEKHSVMMCITLGNWNQIPDELAPVKQPPRHERTCTVELRYQPGPVEGHSKDEMFQFYGIFLTIELDRSAKLIGFRLVTPENGPSIEKAFKNFKINLYTVGDNAVMGSGCSKDRFLCQGKEYYKVTSMHQLAAGIKYRLTLELTKSIIFPGIPYILESPISYNSNAHGQLRLSLHNKDNSKWCAVKINELIFELF
jgi:hypothetical protein